MRRRRAACDQRWKIKKTFPLGFLASTRISNRAAEPRECCGHFGFVETNAKPLGAIDQLAG